MRNEPRTFDFTDGVCLMLFSYEPINDTQAKVSGMGKLWDDRLRTGDSLLIKTRNGKGLLVVDEIQFVGANGLFDAVVSLGEEVLPNSEQSVHECDASKADSRNGDG